jgi:hypothetical protein
MSVSAFIDDGYEETAFIRGVEKLHPAIRVTFRPLPIMERTALTDAIGKLAVRGQNREEEKMAASAMAERITTMHVLNDDGSIAVDMSPPKAEQLLRAKPALYLKMTNIILWGIIGGDHDPFEGQEKPSLSPAQQLEADQKN